MHPGHRKPGGHAFLSDAVGGNGRSPKRMELGSGSGVRAMPRGPASVPKRPGQPETPRGVASTCSQTPGRPFPPDRDPRPRSASGGSCQLTSPAHARGGGGVRRGRRPAHARRELPSCSDPQHPPQRLSQPRGLGRHRQVPDGRKFPSGLTRAQCTMAPVAPRQSASVLGQGLQLPDTPAARRARPLPGGHLVWATRGGRRSQGGQEEGFHPCHPGGPAGQGTPAGEGVGARQAEKSQQPLRGRRRRPGDR